MVQSRWRQEASYDTLSRAGHAACNWNSKLLVFGGRLSATFFADVWAYDTATRTWDLLCDSWPHAPRSYHSTTLVGGEVWLCGGSDADKVVEEVLVYNPSTHRWRTPALRGDTALLRRTAHGACLHPARPDCILLHGGYGGGNGGSATQDYSYLNDLVEINTRTGVVRTLCPAGAAPEPRAYHTFAQLGACCYVIAGRAQSNRLVKGKQAVMGWDAAANKWVTPGVVGGELAPRSSHRAVSVPGGILLFGGAVDRGAKAADLQLLVAGPQGRLSWRQCPAGSGENGGGSCSGVSSKWPAARGAYAAEVVGGRFYVLGGYGEGRQYTGDCWSISLEVTGGGDAAPPASAPPQRDAAAGPSGGFGSQAGGLEASQWRDARRSRPAGAAFGSQSQTAAAAAKRQRLAPPHAQVACRAADTGPLAAAGAASPPACGAALLPASAPVGPAAASGLLPGLNAASLQLPQQQPPAALLAPTDQHQQQQQHHRVQELETALQQQQVAAAAREQLLTDLERENASLRDQCVRWEALARDWKTAELGVAEAAQKHKAELAELHRQLTAAQRDRDAAARAAGAAEAKAEAELQELRSQQRRERDAQERAELERDRYIDELKRQLAEARQSLDKATESNATQAKLLDAARADLNREQRAVGESRKAQAEERERFTASLQDHKEQLSAAQHERDTAAALLAAEKRAFEQTRAELDRQTTQAQAQAERATRAEEARDAAQQAADEARSEVRRLAAAEERWRTGRAAVAAALTAAQRGLEGMP